MAVGDEGMHAELVGQGESLPIVALGHCDVGSTLMRGNLAEEPEGSRLVGASTTLAGKGQGSSGEFESVLEPVSEDVCFAQIHQEERLV